MFPHDAFRVAIEEAVRVLNKLEIPFHITGGLSYIVYAEPRLTQDVDLNLTRMRQESRPIEGISGLHSLSLSELFMTVAY